MANSTAGAAHHRSFTAFMYLVSSKSIHSVQHPIPERLHICFSLTVHTNTNRRTQFRVHSGLMIFKGGAERQANRQLRYLLQQHYHSVTRNCTKQADVYEPRLPSVELPSTGHHLNLAPYLSYTATRSKKSTSTPTAAKLSNRKVWSRRTLYVSRPRCLGTEQNVPLTNSNLYHWTIQTSYTPLLFSHHQWCLKSMKQLNTCGIKLDCRFYPCSKNTKRKIFRPMPVRALSYCETVHYETGRAKDKRGVPIVMCYHSTAAMERCE
jgi:hypothetical protein